MRFIFTYLKKLRKEKELSDLDMATIIGLETRTAYYKKENGIVKFSLDEARVISNFFELSIEEIFFSNEDSNMDT